MFLPNRCDNCSRGEALALPPPEPSPGPTIVLEDERRAGQARGDRNANMSAATFASAHREWLERIWGGAMLTVGG